MAELKTAPKKALKRVKTAPKEGSKGFAVILTGGKQFRVKVGQSLKIEKIIGDHKEGDSLKFDKVLLKEDGAEGITLGTPFIDKAKVEATITKISRYKTVDVIKYKQKSRYFKKYGHRQPYFEVKIDSIN